MFSSMQIMHPLRMNMPFKPRRRRTKWNGTSMGEYTTTPVNRINPIKCMKAFPAVDVIDFPQKMNCWFILTHFVTLLSLLNYPSILKNFSGLQKRRVIIQRNENAPVKIMHFRTRDCQKIGKVLMRCNPATKAKTSKRTEMTLATNLINQSNALTVCLKTVQIITSKPSNKYNSVFNLVLLLSLF
jgi:hypothetical protein